MKRLATVLSVFLILFVGTGALHAEKPFVWTGSGGADSPIGYCEDAGFEVWESVTWVFKAKAFFNKDGEWIKTKWHWTVEGYVYNFDAPENQLPYKNVVYNETYDPVTGEDKYAGLWALVTVPGYGSIFMDVGLIIFDENFNIIFEAGKHQWWYANVDALCEHLD